MEFFEGFELPPQPPEVWRQRRRTWHQSDTVMPVSVPGEALLLRTGGAAVWIGALRAYPNGFEFTLRALRRERPPGPTRQAGYVDPFSGGLRLGLVYADGRKGAMGTGLAHALSYPDSDEDALRLIQNTAGGSESVWDAQFWAAPLPPGGAVTFVAAWPEAGVPEERSSALDGAAIRAAGLRALPLWPDEEFLDDGPATTLITGSADAAECESGPGEEPNA